VSGLRVGDAAPRALKLDFTAPAGIDLTTVTLVTGTLYRSDGTTVDWSFTISPGATAAAMSAVHVLAADGSDLPVQGAYRCATTLTFPSAVTRRPDVARFTVSPYP
jgi:hypothetical protein